MKLFQKPVILTFSGNIISIDECKRVTDAVRACFHDGNPVIGVDCSAVSGISGSFAGFLSETQKEIHAAKGRLFFFNANRQICDILQTLGMDDVIHNEFIPRKGRNPLVLIVEDDPTVRNLYQIFLNDLGYDTLEAVNGKEGLELFEKNRDRITFLLLDIEMPVMDGKQMFEELYKRDPEIRVIMATGYTQTENIRKITACKDVVILKKPFLRADLEKAIQITFRKSVNPSDRN